MTDAPHLTSSLAALHLTTLMAHVRKKSTSEAALRVLETYAAHEPVSLVELRTAQDYQVAVQGAALMGDVVTFHQALDQAPGTLAWEADVFHPFYLVHQMRHAPELFERVADPEVISELADRLSDQNMIQVDPWLATGVKAGVFDPADNWQAVLPKQSFPQVEAARSWRQALERQRQAADERPSASGRRHRLRT